MKKYFFALFILASCNYSQKTSKQVSQPAIKFNRDTINFGSVKLGDSVQVAFHFNNIGDAGLQILTVESGCSCSVAKYPHKVLSAGAGDDVVVKYASAHEKKGSFVTKMFVVQTNSKPSIHVLALQGLVN